MQHQCLNIGQIWALCESLGLVIDFFLFVMYIAEEESGLELPCVRGLELLVTMVIVALRKIRPLESASSLMQVSMESFLLELIAALGTQFLFGQERVKSYITTCCVPVLIAPTPHSYLMSKKNPCRAKLCIESNLYFGLRKLELLFFRGRPSSRGQQTHSKTTNQSVPTILFLILICRIKTKSRSISQGQQADQTMHQ